MKNKISLPGFTAKNSLSRARKNYNTAYDLEVMEINHVIYPQLSLQRFTGPGGPIGLPGSDCYGACFHICMTFGGKFDECDKMCQGECPSPSPFSQLIGLII